MREGWLGNLSDDVVLIYYKDGLDKAKEWVEDHYAKTYVAPIEQDVKNWEEL